MAHFYGVVKGQARTRATRCGSKRSGLRTSAKTWDAEIEVVLNYNSTLKQNEYRVVLYTQNDLPRVIDSGTL